MTEPYIQITLASDDLLQAAKRRAASCARNTPPESVMARALVLQELEHMFGVAFPFPTTDKHGAPQPIDGCEWSTAHKGDWIAVALYHQPIGIDIEVRKHADPHCFSLLSDQDWHIMGERNEDNFLALWTAKEAVIKQKRLTLDDHGALTLCSKDGNELLLEYHHTYSPVRTKTEPDYTYAYTL
jgi:phosphopantetheinyl transferase